MHPTSPPYCAPGVLEGILDKLDQGCILLSADYGLRYMNARARAILKQTGFDETVEGRVILDHCFCYSDIRLSESVAGLRNGHPFTWTMKYAGCLINKVQFSLDLFDESANKSGLLLKMVDLSDYEAVEQALNKSNERYLLATRASYDMIWERDFARDRYYFSEAIHSIYQYDTDIEWSRDDVMNILVHPDDRKLVADFVGTCYRSKVQLFQCPPHRYICKDGTVIWVDVRCYAVYDEAGNNKRTIGVTRDISRQHFLEEDLREQSAQLEYKNKELERFVSVASHDLQEPLRTISSVLSLFHKKYHPILDEKGRQFIDISVNSSKRMLGMVRGLLDLGKVGENDKRESVDSAEVMAEVLDDLALVIKEKEAHFYIQKSMPTIIANKSELYQVFLNLLSNALKYTSDVPPFIQVSWKEFEHHWQFGIEDNGIGIEEEYHQKIFELFQRVRHRDEYAGTGIGLSIVKKIVNSWGGTITVKSRQGEGSFFAFTILKMH